MTMTLTEFLLARIAEDEKLARLYEDGFSMAECEAKRRIVSDLHVDRGDQACASCSYYEDFVIELEDCETLRALVQPYADAPDFKPEWKITG